MSEVLLTTRKYCVERRQTGVPGGSVDVVVHPGAAVILPILPDGRVLLIENYRYTLGQTLLELPAGTLDPGENPRDCASRELIEETGYAAGRLEPLIDYYPTPGFCTERMHLFLAHDLKPGSPRREPGERIENRPMEYEQVLEAIAAGRIIDGKTLVGVLCYDRFERGNG